MTGVVKSSTSGSGVEAFSDDQRAHLSSKLLTDEQLRQKAQSQKAQDSSRQKRSRTSSGDGEETDPKAKFKYVHRISILYQTSTR